MTNVASYTRASTEDQVQGHQHDAILDWARENDIDPDDIDNYSDVGSGASDDREGFNELQTALRSSEVDTLVVWEISRISRKGATLQEFFDDCAENGVTIHIPGGKVDKIEPDGTGRFVADIVSMVYQEERRQLIQRTEAGLRRAIDEGKWAGQTPKGFRRDDNGYLTPVLNPDTEDGETGYIQIQRALERVDGGESYRSVAEDIPNCTRPTLMNIDKDDERRKWYLEGEATDDERVADALDEIPDGTRTAEKTS